MLVASLTSQQHASVSKGRICSDKRTVCHTEIEVADTFCITQAQYTDSGPTTPSADPVTPGAWQGSHWSTTIFEVTGMTRHGERFTVQGGIEVRGRYHGDRRSSSDDSFHSPTVIPPSTLDKPSTMKRYHRRRTCSHTSPRRLPTMVTLHDTLFVECRWWNDGWTVKTVVT